MKFLILLIISTAVVSSVEPDHFSDADQIVVNFTLSNLTKDEYFISSESKYEKFVFKSGEDKNGKISIFIEDMRCSPQSTLNDEFRGLTIKSSGGEWKICSTFDYSEHPTDLDTYYKFSGDEEFEVIRSGNWTSDSDQIVANIRVSLYTESSSCSECPGSTFCCGTSRYCELPGDFVNVRCIPESLLCDLYLDCGRRCDADESTQQCVVFYYFMQWNLMFTLTTILIFLIIIPGIVVTGIKLHRSSQTNRRNHVIRHQQRQGRTRGRVSVVSMDLPPPNYMDLQRNAVDASPPCFCQAVRVKYNDNLSESCSCKK